MSEPTNKTYKIRTVLDIYHLPTVEQVKACMAELTDTLISTRGVSEDFMSTAKALGQNPELSRIIPDEVFEWTDDGENTTSVTLEFGVDANDRQP